MRWKGYTKGDLQNHIESQHDVSMTIPSMISEADDSSWKYVACNACENKFQNEQDLAFHVERVHGYGELCEMYPCEHCGYRSADIVALNSHIEESHRETLYGKRKKQNLQNMNIDLDEDSDDDREWNPADEEVINEEENVVLLRRKKRKITNQPIAKSKKQKLDPANALSCKKCLKSFARKDSLTRHIKNYCK